MLRDYQQKAVEYTESELTRRNRVLLASPTGTGKSYVINALKRGPCDYVVSPKVEIIQGMLLKAGYDGESYEAWGYFTPIRLRNLLARGDITQPSRLIIDEPHHSTADSYQELIALSACEHLVGLTATPYRGTPRGTKALIDFWGEPQWIITYEEAFERGYISCPTFKIVPLVDDDIIKLVNGEFQVESANEAIRDAIAGLRELCRTYVQSSRWDRPTMLSVPSVESAQVTRNGLAYADIPCEVITADTKNRDELFAGCIERRWALIQINVVSEGVDLPLRRLIDLQPTMSPVRWIQTLGRITRRVDDGEPSPEYICTNRNLLRHAHVLDGVVPAKAISDGISAFGGTLGGRTGARVLGFESLGKFKGTEFPLADGTLGLLYAVSRVQGNQVTEFAIICTPRHSEPVCAKRERVKGAYGTKWTRCELPEITEGYASVPARPLTDKQLAWWKRSARTRGLDPDAEINRRQFCVLPILFDLGVRLA